jgi:fumarate reductase subunit D
MMSEEEQPKPDGSPPWWMMYVANPVVGRMIVGLFGLGIWATLVLVTGHGADDLVAMLKVLVGGVFVYHVTLTNPKA